MDGMFKSIIDDDNDSLDQFDPDQFLVPAYTTESSTQRQKIIKQQDLAYQESLSNDKRKVSQMHL